ncbi:MAG: hypothetical protein ACAH11_09055 [Sphingomonas sp.]
MPVPILLALLAQGPTLDADPYKAGLTCADAWVVAAPAENLSRFETTSGVGHYLMQAAAADTKGKPFLDRVTEVNNAAKPKDVSLADAQALMPQCDKRFPLGRTREPAKLPADPLDRDFLCFAVISIQVGAATGMAREEHDDSMLKRWQPIQDLYAGRLDNARLVKAGLKDGPAVDAAFNRVMLGSLQIGNVDSISRACETAARP